LTVFRKMKHLKLKCKPLDELLGGGIESDAITEIYGEAGTGKTNFCLQAARECANNGKKVAYIDSEGVSMERLNQICANYDKKKILSNILFFNPFSFEEQEKMVINAIKLKDAELIIFDTFNMFFRMQFDEDENCTSRSLNRQITDLQIAARAKKLYVIISGQVYTSEKEEIKPFAGRGIEHMAKTIIKLEKTGLGKRKATIIKHRSQPEGKHTIFSINSKGLE